MNDILKILGLIAFSGVKFFLAPSTVLISGYSYVETLAITITGGILGILVFFYFGELLKNMAHRIWKNKKQKPVFSKSSRRLAGIKLKYGLIGLAFLTPFLLSVPIGSLLAARYFDHDKRTIPFLIISVLFWSLTLTSISYFFGTFL